MKKIKIIFLFLAFCAVVYSCKEETVIIPAEVMKSEELVPVLADIQIAQASLVIFEYTDTSRYQLKEYQMAILNKKNISEERFTNSMKFYSEHPELLQEIYNQVVNELSKRQGELENKLPSDK